MSTLTPEQARSYLERWKLVNETETQELRNTPLDIKGRQLAVLMASRHLFQEDQDRESGIRVIRERWRRIREAFRG